MFLVLLKFDTKALDTKLKSMWNVTLAICQMNIEINNKTTDVLEGKKVIILIIQNYSFVFIAMSKFFDILPIKINLSMCVQNLICLNIINVLKC